MSDGTVGAPRRPSLDPPPRAAPGDGDGDAAPAVYDDPMEELRRLLGGPDRQLLDDLRERLDDPDRRAALDLPDDAVVVLLNTEAADGAGGLP